MAKANTKKATPTVNHPTTPEEKKKALDTAMEQIIKKEKQQNIFRRMLEDKRAIRECIRKGGDLKKLAKDRGIKFAKPL